MKKKCMTIGILLAILIILPLMVYGLEVREGGLDIFNEFDIEVISNQGKVYYCEFILNHIELLALSTEAKDELTNKLNETIQMAETENYDAVKNKIQNDLLPFVDETIENESQKKMIKDLLELQKYIYEMNMDYIGIPNGFESNVIDHLTGEQGYCLVGVTIHFSGCFTVDNHHIKDCSKITVSITLKKTS